MMNRRTGLLLLASLLAGCHDTSVGSDAGAADLAAIDRAAVFDSSITDLSTVDHRSAADQSLPPDLTPLPDLVPPIDLSCTPTGAEDCFDGIDNDCNGHIDCDDPACAPSAECVPDAPGFQLGTNAASGAACPTGYDAAATTVNQGLNAPLVCGGCSCTPSLVCSTTIHTMTAATCPNGTLVAPTVSVDSASCSDNGGAGYNITTQNVRVDALTKNASCSAGGTPTPQAATWSATTQFCQTSHKGGGCSPGSVCVPRVPTGSMHCVLQAGASSCPGSYNVQGAGAWYTGLNDTRSCGASCAAVCSAAGGSCGTSFVKAYLANSCTGAADFLTPGMDNCGESVGENAFQVVLQNSSNPTCTVNYNPAGAATPTGPQTLCCF